MKPDPLVSNTDHRTVTTTATVLTPPASTGSRSNAVPSSLSEASSALQAVATQGQSYLSANRYRPHASPLSDSGIVHDPYYFHSSDSETASCSSFSTFPSTPGNSLHGDRRRRRRSRGTDLDWILNPVAEEPLLTSFSDFSFFDTGSSCHPSPSSSDFAESTADQDCRVRCVTETFGMGSPIPTIPEEESSGGLSSPGFKPTSMIQSPTFAPGLDALVQAIPVATGMNEQELYAPSTSQPEELPPTKVARLSETLEDSLEQKCKWSTCAAVFNSIDELTRHLYKLHVSGRNQGFTCKWASCHIEKGNTDDLIQHVCSQHLGQSELRHVCGWHDCQHEFKTFDDLTAHLSSDHVGSGKSQYYCRWKFCTRGEKPFSQRQRAMRHIQTHTGDKPFQCITCGKRFSESHIMAQHIRIHTGERPFKCRTPDCGRTFAVSSALTIHNRTHTGEKPFKCRFEGCNKRFAESSNLTKHMRVHTGERPFRCPVESCSKKFSRPDQVSRHQKTHIPSTS
ncbi:zinc-finger protein [Dispira parvispora]|uniref:Zinc-finger protein n=1 Tax=Dispira parvispora TaxID=1520584 RepID=A0A9W8E692_9FUNG|nr:zinc-finger protein [Dispira parvispora]